MKGIAYRFVLLLLLFPLIAFGVQGSYSSKDTVEARLKKAYDYKNGLQFGMAVNELNVAVRTADTLSQRAFSYKYLFKGYSLFIELYLDFNLDKDLEVYEFLCETHLKPGLLDGGDARFTALKALLAARKGNFEAASENLKKAKSLYGKDDGDIILHYIWYYEARIALLQKEYDKAIDLFARAYPLEDPYEEAYLNSGILLYLSAAHLKMQHYDQALSYARKAEKTLSAHNFPRMERWKNQQITAVLRHRGLHREAERYQQKTDSLKDRYFNPATLKYIETIGNHNTSFFKDKVIEKYKAETLKQARQVNTSKLISIFSSVLLIIIGILTVSLYRNSKIKLKTNRLLLKKNQALRTAKDKAENALKVKARFLSTVSHELRTPLYAVTGLTHLLLEDNPRESQKEYLNSLKFSGEYLLNFINDILQINKSEANRLKLNKAPFNLKQMLAEVAGSLEHSARENNNAIILNIDGNIPDSVTGDALKLSQVFINLIGNALKFTSNGEVRITGQLVSQEKNHVRIRFEVKDNGMGITAETMPHIFESFAQGSTQINRKYGGTGLGLTIVKSLLHLMESDIVVQSIPEEGSTFSFELDMETSRELPPSSGPTEQDTAVPRDAVTEETDFENIHILLVEDNKINQMVTQKMLSKKDISCDIANDGYEAIKMAKKKSYDLILMDIHMPGISGIKATEEIRRFNKTVPVVALTAISLEDNMDNLYQAGCNDIITKPFKPEVFYKKIRNNLRLNRK
ncbi:response regulator [Sinomicrobium soli]|uniref:response regulator n=1 Tax=Sinomicrobium sp. N-1-3-6 TaxID=2219864 RepID=UPI000DCF3743|nr:response regulator [Sinomicrobium sp. N-1-3-6]RAV30532.1 hybrid sensor histidine kinase/response regulator [Sinomicrobium sp. N-1-3-6]